jgi:DNA-binding ferritin-like protein
MYSTFTNAYLFNLIINTIILISIAANSYTSSTLLGGILLASYGWLFAISYTLYKDDNTPDCLKRIAITTMVFASLFMILIPVAVLLFNESINRSVIKTICGDETGNECKDKMVDWYKRNVNEKIDQVTEKLDNIGKKSNEVVKKAGEKYKEFKTKKCEDLRKDIEKFMESDRTSINEMENKYNNISGEISRLNSDDIRIANELYVNAENNTKLKEDYRKKYEELLGNKNALETKQENYGTIRDGLKGTYDELQTVLDNVLRAVQASRCPDYLFENAKEKFQKAHSILAKDRGIKISY